LSRELDATFKVGAVVTTLFLFVMLFLTVSGWGGRIYRLFKLKRHEALIVEHSDFVSELTGFVDSTERLLGNVGSDGSLTRLHESIIQDMQTANLLKNATTSPSLFYTWIHYVKTRASRVGRSPQHLRTSEFAELAGELGSLIGSGGDYVRYYLQNLVNDPAYTPSKVVRDAYDVFKELHNRLTTDYERYVKKVNGILGTEIGFYANHLRNLK